MIVGIGVDVVDVARFEVALARTPRMSDRLFAEHERRGVDGSPRTVTSLAARFAAKEAVAKALGAPAGLEWHDCVVVSDADGRPSLQVRGTVMEAADRLGITHWHLSLSHDGGVATAMVVAEAATAPEGVW